MLKKKSYAKIESAVQIQDDIIVIIITITTYVHAYPYVYSGIK